MILFLLTAVLKKKSKWIAWLKKKGASFINTPKPFDMEMALKIRSDNVINIGS